jgi:hypothetical protein
VACGSETCMRLHSKDALNLICTRYVVTYGSEAYMKKNCSGVLLCNCRHVVAFVNETWR